jgi:hypothetical protein
VGLGNLLSLEGKEKKGKELHCPGGLENAF